MRGESPVESSNNPQAMAAKGILSKEGSKELSFNPIQTIYPETKAQSQVESNQIS